VRDAPFAASGLGIVNCRDMTSFSDLERIESSGLKKIPNSVIIVYNVNGDIVPSTLAARIACLLCFSTFIVADEILNPELNCSSNQALEVNRYVFS